MYMFWAFRLSFAVDMLAFCRLFGLLLDKLGFFKILWLPCPGSRKFYSKDPGSNYKQAVTQKWYHTQHNDIQPNDTQHNVIQPNDTQYNKIQPNDTQHNI